MSTRTPFSNRLRVVVPLLVLALHVAAAVWIVVDYRRTDKSLGLLAVSALPVAQASLLATWAALGRTPSYARAPVLCAGLAAIWFVECRALDWDATDNRSAAHALMFVVQAALVILALAVVRCGGWLRRRHHDPRAAGQRIQFSLGFVLGWTCALGLMLGLGRTTLHYTGWTTEVFHNPLFLFGLVVGAYNGLIGLTVFAAAACGRRWRVLWQILFGLGLAALLASSERVVLERLFQRDGSMVTIAWVVQAGFHAGYLLVTLGALRLANGFAGQASLNQAGRESPRFASFESSGV